MALEKYFGLLSKYSWNAEYSVCPYAVRPEFHQDLREILLGMTENYGNWKGLKRYCREKAFSWIQNHALIYNKHSLLNSLLWDQITLQSISKRVFFFPHVFFFWLLIFLQYASLSLVTSWWAIKDLISLSSFSYPLPAPNWTLSLSEHQFSSSWWSLIFLGILCPSSAGNCVTSALS